MRFSQSLVPGRFLRRVNRFAALVEVKGWRGKERSSRETSERC